MFEIAIKTMINIIKMLLSYTKIASKTYRNITKLITKQY